MENFDKVIEACVGKLNKEDPYCSLSWGEIADTLGLEYHPDNLRKGAYFIKKYFDYLQDVKLENMTSDDIEKINEKLIELEKEKVKVQDMKSSLKRQLRPLARYEQMLDTAREVGNVMNQGKPLLANPPVLRSGNKEAVLLLSDLHIGIVNDNHWNKYDTNVMKDRMSYLKQRVIQICMEQNIGRVRVLCIGDIISGLIHSTIRLENRENVVEQSMIAAEVISELLVSLSNLVKVDLYYAVGNHERISSNKSDSLDKENFGYFILEMIKLRCQFANGITIHENDIDDELITLDVFRDKIVATHGNNFGNLNTYVPKLTSMLGYVPDYVCIGHFHQPIEKSYGNTELLVNASFSGVDTYAKNYGLVGKPMQKLMIFSEEYGKEATYNIKLEV